MFRCDVRGDERLSRERKPSRPNWKTINCPLISKTKPHDSPPPPAFSGLIFISHPQSATLDIAHAGVHEGGTSLHSENPVGRKIFTEWQMRVVSRSTYISQFPDVMAQKALLGSMRRGVGGGGGRRWRRRAGGNAEVRGGGCGGGVGEAEGGEEGGFSPPSFARTTQNDKGEGGGVDGGGCGRHETGR